MIRYYIFFISKRGADRKWKDEEYLFFCIIYKSAQLHIFDVYVLDDGELEDWKYDDDQKWGIWMSLRL